MIESDVSTTLREILSTQRPAAPSTAERTIRWVLAHEPPVVFEDASLAFVEHVREKTHGDVDVELYSTDEFVAGRGGDEVSRTGLVDCLARGEIEMAHTYVSALGSFHAPLWAIEMPFLFRDYDHAHRVFESPIAARLMADMVPQGIRGLSFAYSGGFRIIASTGRRLETLDDFAGMRVRTAGNPVPKALFGAVGANARSGALQHIAHMTGTGEIDAAEITYVRFMATGLHRVHKVVNETGHSLFTTMMAINERFFRRLSDVQQAAVYDAGREAGRLERERSIHEEGLTRDRCPDEGVEVVRMRDDARDAFREIANQVYDRFAPTFGAELIAEIRAAA